jgi:hypothetical protein
MRERLGPCTFVNVRCELATAASGMSFNASNRTFVPEQDCGGSNRACGPIITEGFADSLLLAGVSPKNVSHSLLRPHRAHSLAQLPVSRRHRINDRHHKVIRPSSAALASPPKEAVPMQQQRPQSACGTRPSALLQDDMPPRPATAASHYRPSTAGPTAVTVVRQPVLTGRGVPRPSSAVARLRFLAGASTDRRLGQGTTCAIADDCAPPMCVGRTKAQPRRPPLQVPIVVPAAASPLRVRPSPEVRQRQRLAAAVTKASASRLPSARIAAASEGARARSPGYESPVPLTADELADAVVLRGLSRSLAGRREDDASQKQHQRVTVAWQKFMATSTRRRS